MAPKRPVKPKKEESVEIPKTSTLPDGSRVHFVGGWSTRKELTGINEITIDRFSGERILLLPGTFDAAHTTLTVRTLSIEGLSVNELITPAAPAKEVDAEGDAPPEELPPVSESEPVVDRSVVIKGKVNFEAWIPPVEVKAPTPPPLEDKKETKPKPGGKDKKKAVVIEEEAPPPAPIDDSPPAVGANPAAWPTVNLRKMCFSGSVETKGVHLVIEECHFSGVNGHQLIVHQYCQVILKRCTFSTAAKSCIYAFPRANVDATECVFSGSDLFLQQQALAPNATPSAISAANASEAAAKACSSSVGLFIDDAVVTVTKCKFRELTTGVMVHEKSLQTQISKCEFHRIFSIGCYLDGAHCIVKGNIFRHCDYYALRARGKTAAKVLNNEFQSQLYIEKGASPLLFGNMCALRVIDNNETGNVYMEPTY